MAKESKKEEKNMIAEAKEARRLAHEQKPVIKKENSREEFRKFFIKLKAKHDLDKGLEEVIWLHFQSAGFDKKEKFAEGAAHFGLR